MKKTTRKNTYASGYNKMSTSQWVVVYLLLGALVYGLMYFFMTNKGMYGKTTETPVGSELVMVERSPVKGEYLVDETGMALYIFDKDKVGKSNCNGDCLVEWPPFLASSEAPVGLPVNLTIITRSDGTKQYAWSGLPLYYYARDAEPGDVLGDGMDGTWHLVMP